MPLFEVAILSAPSKKEKEEGIPESLVFGPKAVVAADIQSAAIAAILDNSENLKNIDKSKMQVLIRPFVQVSPQA